MSARPGMAIWGTTGFREPAAQAGSTAAEAGCPTKAAGPALVLAAAARGTGLTPCRVVQSPHLAAAGAGLAPMETITALTETRAIRATEGRPMGPVCCSP